MSWQRKLVAQFHQPSGSWGQVAGWIMTHRGSNLRRNQWTLDLLDLKASDAVCELGPGPGVTLGRLLKECGRVVAVDHSALMLKKCRSRHRRAVKDGHLELHHADFTQMPEIDPVDKILAVNALQFDALNETALNRIIANLKPEGILAVTFQPRGTSPTEEDVDYSAAKTASILKRVGLLQQREQRLALQPASAVCILASRGNTPGQQSAPV